MEYKHFGVYGLVIENNKILLVKKVSGPYDGKLDLPGGTIEFGERPCVTLIREFKEETGLDIKKYELIDCDSVRFNWIYDGKNVDVHHTGIFYKVIDYDNDIKREIDIDDVNDDSLGAEFYDINKLNKDELSNMVILVLNNLNML